MQQKDMEGALFKNDKGGNEKRPDYRGNITINGTTYKLSSWVNTIKQGDKAGEKYMSLKAEADQARPAYNNQDFNQNPATTNDGLPF